ncbi:MAG: hypothetical protein WBP79_07990 [Candidatus Acidiferrales bacterium]
MAALECPVCHARASLVGNKPYCPACGWNRDIAIANLRGTLKMAPVGFAVFAAFAFFVTHRAGHFGTAPLALFLGFPAAMMALNYVLLLRRLKKLQELPSAMVKAPATEPGWPGSNPVQPSAAVLEPSDRDKALLRTSRPRELRMASRGKFAIAVVSLVVVGFLFSIGAHLHVTWVRTQSFANFHGPEWGLTGFCAFLALIPFAMWRSQVREKDLLENGEIALGRVTRQWGGKDSNNVEYEFKDYQGQTHKALSFDYTKKLFEGMAVAVFYDRDNPKRQIASCATYHEVVA